MSNLKHRNERKNLFTNVIHIPENAYIELILVPMLCGINI